MSETSEGPDWWQASDGKWYPPHSHPDYVASQSEPEPEPQPERPASRYLWTTTPTATPAAGADTPAVAPMAPPATDWSPPARTPVATTDVSAPAPAPATRGTPSKTPWVIGVVILLALAVVAVVVALTAGSGSGSTLPTGSSTATIDITLPRTGQPSFSGTVAGRALTGKVVGAASSFGGTSSSSGSLGGTSASSGSFQSGTLATYEGKLGGTAYVLHVSIDVANSQSALQSGNFAFKVTGTYGSEPVTATASFALPTSTNGQSPPVAVTGHVGTQVINGVAVVRSSVAGSLLVTANFSVVP